MFRRRMLHDQTDVAVFTVQHLFDCHTRQRSKCAADARHRAQQPSTGTATHKPSPLSAGVSAGAGTFPAPDLARAAAEPEPAWVDQASFSDYLDDTTSCEAPTVVLLQTFPRVARALAAAHLVLVHAANGHPDFVVELAVREAGTVEGTMSEPRHWGTWRLSKPKPEQQLCATTNELDDDQEHPFAIRFPLHDSLCDVVGLYLKQNVPVELWLDQGSGEEGSDENDDCESRGHNSGEACVDRGCENRGGDGGGMATAGGTATAPTGTATLGVDTDPFLFRRLAEARAELQQALVHHWPSAAAGAPPHWWLCNLEDLVLAEQLAGHPANQQVCVDLSVVRCTARDLAVFSASMHTVADTVQPETTSPSQQNNALRARITVTLCD
eukprot:m.245321 g.245321  ORF g.245321 m.245321 type:complete len:383 (-) comp19051_c0_seq1:20-1168(-)